MAVIYIAVAARCVTNSDCSLSVRVRGLKRCHTTLEPYPAASLSLKEFLGKWDYKRLKT